MSASISPPVVRIGRDKAPQPSAALLALQQRGLELPSTRTDSISPQSISVPDDGPRVSPLSITSTPSNFRQNNSDHDISSRSRSRRRLSSVGSAETTVTNILRLYAGGENRSKQSLKSEYEEMSPYEDSDDEKPPLPKVHQPKAYRDTIAPLLEHQFSGDNLAVPVAPSPMSIASMPMLLHPNAAASVPSLNLSPEISPNLQPAVGNNVNASHSSIQITPEMSPSLPATAPSYNEFSHSLRERKVALEVPDVCEADSWYDQPLSPVSPEELDVRLRDSQLSAVSPNENLGYQRALTFEALGPPVPKHSPNVRPVSLTTDQNQPLSFSLQSQIEATSGMIPRPLEVGRSRSHSKVSEGSAPVHQPQVHVPEPHADSEPKSQHASLDLALDPIEGPMRSYLTPPPLDRRVSDTSTNPPVNIEEIYRPGSAFSDSSGSPTHGLFGGQLKSAFKGKFGKKKDKKSSQKGSKSIARDSLEKKIKQSNTSLDDPESYKTAYWKSHTSMSLQSAMPPPHRLQTPDLMNSRPSSESTRRRESHQSGPGPSISDSPPPAGQNATAQKATPPPGPRRQPGQAIPLTDYQKYGPSIWSKDELRKQAKEEEQARRAAEKAKKEATKAAIKAQKQAQKAAKAIHTSKPSRDRLSVNSFLRGHASGTNTNDGYQNFYARPSSKAGPTHSHTTSGSTQFSIPSTDFAASSRPGSSASYASSARKSSGMPASYNNDLFEASGGVKKKGGFASRLMMSSEEKRKQKVKESIVVVGSAKLGSGRSDGKGLVKI